MRQESEQWISGVIFCVSKSENYFAVRCGILLSGQEKALHEDFQERGMRWKEKQNFPWV